MSRIQGFDGTQFLRDGVLRERKCYASYNQQYATSSYQELHDMRPALIVRPKGDKDVQTAVKFAKDNGIAAAVKSGGHQYSGASSTGGKNIQIDLSCTYKDLAVLPCPPDAPYQNEIWICAGVSNRVIDLNTYLAARGLFVPHGQCAYVGLGGHGQTGGYGLLGRSFGLLGDHIRVIRLIGHDSQIHNFSRKSNPDMFSAILGGSPGNFGIITHYTIAVHKDDDYMGVPSTAGTSITDNWGGPRGIRGLWIYHKDTLKNLVKFVTDTSDNPEFPRNFDICVSLLSRDFYITDLFPEIKGSKGWEWLWRQIEKALPASVQALIDGHFPPVIVLYASWCPVDKNDRYNVVVDNWFKQFRALNNVNKWWKLLFEEHTIPMSQLAGLFVFPEQREYDLPCEKRTYGTKSTTLGKDGWVNKIVDQIDLIYNPIHIKANQGTDIRDRYDGCKLSVQIQNFGGNKSRFFTNRDNGTSYSWRDTTIVTNVDCFYDTTKGNGNGKRLAQEWQKVNDEEVCGPYTSFSKEAVNRRFLWGSYGNWDMAVVWKSYYEDEAKYKKIGLARSKADPNGTFTPNPFAVEAVFEQNLQCIGRQSVEDSSSSTRPVIHPNDLGLTSHETC